MISDVLSDAVQEIRSYQAEYPHNYTSVTADIETVVAAMNALRQKLETPSTDDMPALMQCQACGGHPEESCPFCGAVAR